MHNIFRKTKIKNKKRRLKTEKSKYNRNVFARRYVFEIENV